MERSETTACTHENVNGTGPHIKVPSLLAWAKPLQRQHHRSHRQHHRFALSFAAVAKEGIAKQIPMRFEAAAIFLVGRAVTLVEATACAVLAPQSLPVDSAGAAGVLRPTIGALAVFDAGWWWRRRSAASLRARLDRAGRVRCERFHLATRPDLVVAGVARLLCTRGPFQDTEGEGDRSLGSRI